MEREVQMACPVMADTILIDLVVGMVVIMMPQAEVIVALQMIHMELFQMAPHPQESGARCRHD